MNHPLAEINGAFTMLGILAAMGVVAIFLATAWRAARRGAMAKFRNLLSPEAQKKFDSLLNQAPAVQSEAFRTWLVDSGDQGRALAAEKLNGGEQVEPEGLVDWARAIVNQKARETQQKDARQERIPQAAAPSPAAEDWFTGQVAQLIILVRDDGGIANSTRICAVGQGLVERGGVPLLRRAFYAVRAQGKDFRAEIWDSLGLQWRT